MDFPSSGLISDEALLCVGGPLHARFLCAQGHTHHYYIAEPMPPAYYDLNEYEVPLLPQKVKKIVYQKVSVLILNQHFDVWCCEDVTMAMLSTMLKMWESAYNYNEITSDNPLSALFCKEGHNEL